MRLPDRRGAEARIALLGVLCLGSIPTVRAQLAAEGPPHPLWRNDVALIGFTAPVQRAVVTSTQPAVIRRLMAAEGTQVTAGTPLAEFDNAVQLARVEIARLEAESDVDIDIARVRLEHAESELQRLINLPSGAMAAPKELTDARAKERETRLEYAKAIFAQQRAVRQHDLQRRILEELTLRAPFTGYVAEHLKEVGETVDEGEGVMVLARLDPLVVTLDAPIETALAVKTGDPFEVRPAPPLDAVLQMRRGTVIFVSRAADPGSQTCRIRIAVPNDDGQWMSGMKVTAAPVEGEGSGVLDTEPRTLNPEP